jgi:hypothetical protein
MAAGAELRKYRPAKLIAMFRLAARLRNEMLAADFTDNGGAIYSAERIMNILGLALRYPGLMHVNNLRAWPDAQFSQEARIAHAKQEKVLLTRRAIELVTAGASDEELAAFVQQRFCLVLLTAAETLRLNS